MGEFVYWENSLLEAWVNESFIHNLWTLKQEKHWVHIVFFWVQKMSLLFKILHRSLISLCWCNKMLLDWAVFLTREHYFWQLWTWGSWVQCLGRNVLPAPRGHCHSPPWFEGCICLLSVWKQEDKCAYLAFFIPFILVLVYHSWGNILQEAIPHNTITLDIGFQQENLRETDIQTKSIHAHGLRVNFYISKEVLETRKNVNPSQVLESSIRVLTPPLVLFLW